MRIWERNPAGTKCGGCGLQMAIGAPRQVITPDASRSMKRKFYRCQKCGDEPAPADLPPLTSRQVAIEPTPLVRAGMVKLPFDYRMAQTGEREPGSDDE